MAQRPRHILAARPAWHGLVPLPDAPWLTLRSSARLLGSVLVGTLGCLFGINAVGNLAHARHWHTLVEVMAFLLVVTVLCAFGGLAALGMRGIQRRMYQWCPDCLQSMTRGACVCPFCGFRPTPGVLDVSPSRSSQRADAAHS